MCARRRTYLSLLRQRKVGQRKTTLLSVSPSLRYGATCDARSRGVPQNSLRAARYAQTTAASQFTKAGVLRRQPAPRPALLGTARREGGTVRAIAALGLVRGASSAGPSAAMARVGLFTPPCGCATGLPRSAAKGSQTWGRVLCLLSCTSKKGGRPPGRVPASDIKKRSYSRNTRKCQGQIPELIGV
jgi:hypothetical protein